MFAKKQPDQLRVKLAQVSHNSVILKQLLNQFFQLERDHKINKLSEMELNEKKIEILMALKKLGEQLTSSESEYLQANASDSMKEFEKVSSNATLNSEAVIASASSQLKDVIK